MTYLRHYYVMRASGLIVLHITRYYISDQAFTLDGFSVSFRFHSKYDWSTGWTTRVRFQAVAEIFILATASRPTLGHTHRPIQWVPRGVKWPERENHSPPSSPGLVMCGPVPQIPPTGIHDVLPN